MWNKWLFFWRLFSPLTNTLWASSKFKFAKYPKGIKDLILEPRESAFSKQLGVPILNRKSDKGGAGVAHFLSLTGQHLYEKWAQLLTACGGTAIYHITGSREEQDVMSTAWTSELESKPCSGLPRPVFTLFASDFEKELSWEWSKAELINLLVSILFMKREPTLAYNNVSPKWPVAPPWFFFF